VGVAATHKKKYFHPMETIKNYIIAILATLLVVSFSIQPAQSAGKSKDAKIVEYQHCMMVQYEGYGNTDFVAKNCAAFRP
jgi:hypothetical protein